VQLSFLIARAASILAMSIFFVAYQRISCVT
jgi:hypothetical protein